MAISHGALPSGKLQSTLFWGAAVLLIAALFCYTFIDRAVLTLLTRHALPLHRLEWINALRQLGKAWLIIWLLLIFAWTTNWSRPVVLGFLALGLIVPTVLPLKLVVGRPRPGDIIAARHVHQSTDNVTLRSSPSFPSGDTATIVAVSAVLLPFATGLWWLPLMIVAAMIGLLRVTALAHFPSDVCAGAAVGLLVGLFVLRLPALKPLPDLSRVPSLRPAAGIAALALVPIVSFFESYNPVLIFLQTYAPLLIIIMVICHRHHIRKWFMPVKSTS